MKVTTVGLALLEARFGMASAKALVERSPRERLTADLVAHRALVRSLTGSVAGAHPLIRNPVRDRLATLQARIRHMMATLASGRPDRISGNAG